MPNTSEHSDKPYFENSIYFRMAQHIKKINLPLESTKTNKIPQYKLEVFK